jgi:hypothetical protein
MTRTPLDQALSEAEQDTDISRLSRSWGEFLREFHWQLFATATFARPVSATYGVDSAREWIGSLGNDVYAFVGHERGRVGDRIHCHALIGGLFAASRNAKDERLLAAARVSDAWQHGQVQVVPYDPKRGAAFYVSKSPDDGDMIGQWQRHRPRRQRHRTRSIGHRSLASHQTCVGLSTQSLKGDSDS